VRRRAVAAAFLVAVLAGTGGAADRFVSVQGSDVGSNDCLTSTAPCLTIAYALGQASSGDVVKVTAGRYDEPLAITASKVATLSGSWTPDFAGRDAASRGSKLLGALELDAAAGVTIDVTVDGFLLTYDSGARLQSSGNGALTLRLVSTGVDFNRFYDPPIIATAEDASTLDIETTDTSVSSNRVLVSTSGGIFLVSNDTAVLTLTMTDSVVEKNFASAYGTAGIRAYATGTLDIVLTRSRVDRNRGPGVEFQGYMGGTVNMALVDSSVTRNRYSGLAWRGANVSITNSVVARNGGGLGVFLPEAGPTTLQIVNSTIRENRIRCSVDPTCTAGILLQGPSATVGLLNAIVWGNRSGGGTADLVIDGGATVSIDHSDIGEVTGPYDDLGGNISADPRCVSRRDAHLTASSPAIDAGTCAGAPTADFEGDARPTGAGCDIGADEYVP